MTTDIAQRYANQSQRFIQQAHYELEQKGDRLQASEKASGAVAQAVKAIASARGWRHNSHSLRREIVDLLVVEYGRPELRTLQSTADQLHINYYENTLHDWQIADRLAEVSQILRSLWEIGELGANPHCVPTPAQQQTIERLRLSEEEAATIPLIDYPPPLPLFDPETA